MDRLLIVWHDDNNLGIPIIDEQHRGIVSVINTLYHAIRMKRGKEALAHAVNIMKDYSRLHFATEERMLEETGYPGLRGHKELHAELVVKALSVGTESLILGDPARFLHFLEEWWMNHINRHDRLYAPHVREFYKL